MSGRRWWEERPDGSGAPAGRRSDVHRLGVLVVLLAMAASGCYVEHDQPENTATNARAEGVTEVAQPAPAVRQGNQTCGEFAVEFAAAVGPIEDRWWEVSEEIPDVEAILEADTARDEVAFGQLMAEWETGHYRLGTLWEEYADTVAQLSPPTELAADVERVAWTARRAAQNHYAIARFDMSVGLETNVDAQAAIERLVRHPCFND